VGLQYCRPTPLSLKTGPVAEADRNVDHIKMERLMTVEKISNPNNPDFFELLTGSFSRLLGQPLLAPNRGPEWLYGNASFVVLAHSGGNDPKFVYANVAAQKQFGYTWSEFTNLPSRLSAGPEAIADRELVLDAVTRAGFIRNYRGVRVKKSGKEFWIENATIWQLRDIHGNDHGQAATIPTWTDVKEESE
jgi:hypothetical protein